MIAIISLTGRASDCKFGRNSHRVHPNKSLLKIWRKRAWAYPGTAQIFGNRLLSQERVKLRSSTFARIYSKDRSEQNLLKIPGKLAVGVVRDSRKFSGHTYGASRGHHSDSSAFLLLMIDSI